MVSQNEVGIFKMDTIKGLEDRLRMQADRIEALEAEIERLNASRHEYRATITGLQAERDRYCEALFGNNGALKRMDQARRVLHKGPDSNWGVLDTRDIRQALNPDKD